MALGVQPVKPLSGQFGLALLLLATPLTAQTLALPPRPGGAPGGAAIAAAVADLDLEARERVVYAEVSSGNVPSWLRTMTPVIMQRMVEGRRLAVTFWAAPDYLAVGSDDDWFLMPLAPQTAQRIADLTHTSLPTPPMVDAIWHQAVARPGPDSIAPSAAMITVPVFAEHMATVLRRRKGSPAPLGALVAGHKKDVVLTRLLDSLPNRVAIYGWHLPSGVPVQPLWVGHTRDHVDYSHGIRLVSRWVEVGRTGHDITDLLRDPLLSAALSDEGPIHRPGYQRLP
jgi:hypothetical protein